MMKKFITFVLACMLALPSMITCDSSSAASKILTYNITVSVGETKSVTLPNQASYKKYYSSMESNANVSSNGKKGEKEFTLKGVKATKENKPAIVTVTTTSGRKVKYKVTVQSSNSANDNSEPTTEPTDVQVKGDCPYCNSSDCLKMKTVTYKRPAVMTAYVKEPIKDYQQVYCIELRDGVQESLFEAHVKKLGGVIITKDSSGYSILVPQKSAGSERVVDSSIMYNAVGSMTSPNRYYLSEFIVEDVEAESAKSVTLNSGLIECTKCGYVGKQK